MRSAAASSGSAHRARDGALLLLIAVVPAVPTWWRMHAEKVTAVRDPWLLTVQRAREMQYPILWIDARTPERFAAGHVPGAKPLELAEWNRQLPDVVAAWQPGTITVVYCDAEGCDASRDVAARLRQELHLPDVYFLEGGWEAWNATKR